jgi:hypothetical protein
MPIAAFLETASTAKIETAARTCSCASAGRYNARGRPATCSPTGVLRVDDDNFYRVVLLRHSAKERLRIRSKERNERI